MLLNKFLNGCTIPCAQSKIPAMTTPQKRTIWLLNGDKLKNTALNKSCNPGQYKNLSLYGLKYGSSSGLKLLMNLNLNKNFVNSKRALNNIRIEKISTQITNNIVNLTPNNSTLVSTDQNNCLCLIGR